ncbi:MAG: 2-phosphosulfolactate phosphatase [Chryseosolibacter sp.]
MKRTIDVCLSPDLMHLYKVQDLTVVVVDILRATSCMTTAFAHAIHSITPFAKLPECLALKADGYLTAGERDGKKVDGFDLGNSPFEYMDPKLTGKKIAFTTTNGTQAIAKSIGAKNIIIGSFLNLSAVVKYLREVPTDILIVCSGWKGKVNLEDTIYAGALVENLKNDFESACDAPIMAQRLYQQARPDLKEYLKDSSHIKRLERLNIYKDIEFCLTEDMYDIVPAITGNVITAVTP